MKILFRAILAILLILSLNIGVFAWPVGDTPLYDSAEPIEIDTPVEIRADGTKMRCYYFRLSEAGYVQLEIDQPLSGNTKISLLLGDEYNRYLVYSAVPSTEDTFLSPEIGINANLNGYYPNNYYILFNNLDSDLTLTVHYTQCDNWESEPNEGWNVDPKHALDSTYYGTVYNEMDIDFFHYDIQKRSRVYVTLESMDGKPVEDFWEASFSLVDVMYQIENPVLIRNSESKLTYDLGVIWSGTLHVQINATREYLESEEIISHDPSVYSIVVHAEPTDVFPDVPEDAFYADAVKWAIESCITEGTSRYAFSPEAFCTRGQIVTFLYRMPYDFMEPDDYEPVFTDLDMYAYYYYPVYWAYEYGIAKGTSATTFSPDASCTRAQAVTFLWRFAGCPKAENSEISFADVQGDAYYAEAVAWAVENGITLGTSENTFSPDATCTRGQIVTFLYRYMNTIEK